MRAVFGFEQLLQIPIFDIFLFDFPLSPRKVPFRRAIPFSNLSRNDKKMRKSLLKWEVPASDKKGGSIKLVLYFLVLLTIFLIFRIIKKSCDQIKFSEYFKKWQGSFFRLFRTPGSCGCFVEVAETRFFSLLWVEPQ